MKSYITVEHTADGPRVTDHATKKAAGAHGKALRNAGKVAFIYPSEEAMKLGLDPRLAA